MVTQQVAIDLTKNFINDLNGIGLNLRKAYIYGSFACHRQHKHLDIDVALVADEFTGLEPVDIKLMLKVLSKYVLIHAKTFSIQDYYEGNPFLDEIKWTGMEII